MSQTEDARTRRKFKRVTAREVFAQVKRRGESMRYPVVNISLGGLLISGDRPPAQGTMLELELQLRGAKSVTVQGHVVHAFPDGAGIAFESLTQEVGDAIAKLVAVLEASVPVPPPLPAGRTRREEELPTVGPRPTGDAFGEGADPRPPRSGSPDERAEYLRALLKNRDEALKRGRAMLTAVVAEIDEVRAVATRLKAKLDNMTAQQAVSEAALTAARAAIEKHAAEVLAERRTNTDRLEEEQQRTLEAIATVSGLEAKLRRQEADLSAAREQAEVEISSAEKRAAAEVTAARKQAEAEVAATRKQADAEVAAARKSGDAATREAKAVLADAAGARKAREELVTANRKAMEAQSAANKEKEGRAAAEAAAETAKHAWRAAEEEVRRLTPEVQKLKARLIAVEAALERAATKKPAAPPARGPTR